MNAKRKTNTLATLWVAGIVLCVLAAFAIARAQTTTSAVSTQMSPGDSGSQVSALQTFLAADATIYPEGLITGYYGNLTLAAVQRYQCKNGLVCSGDVASTGYGRVGPATLAKIAMQQGTNPGGGTTLPSISYPSISGDVNAPIISAATVATSSTSATIMWATNEPARSRVMYATTWPFVYAYAFSANSSSGVSQNASATLSGLSPHTTYYYVLESVDASGNLQWDFNGFHNSFTTNL